MVMVMTNALPFPLKLVGIQEAHKHIDVKKNGGGVTSRPDKSCGRQCTSCASGYQFRGAADVRKPRNHEAPFHGRCPKEDSLGSRRMVQKRSEFRSHGPGYHLLSNMIPNENREPLKR